MKTAKPLQLDVPRISLRYGGPPFAEESSLVVITESLREKSHGMTIVPAMPRRKITGRDSTEGLSLLSVLRTDDAPLIQTP